MLHFLAQLIPTAYAVEATTKLSYQFPGQPQTVADPGTYISTIYTFAVSIVGLIAFGFIIYGGIRYILSAGNPSALTDARDRIISAFIGIALLLGAYIILKEIDPRLLKLEFADIKEVSVASLNFTKINKLKEQIADDIKNGRLSEVRRRFEELRTTDFDYLTPTEAALISENPDLAAQWFNELDASGKKQFIQRQTMNRPGSPSYNPLTQVSLGDMFKRIPNETLFDVYGNLSATERSGVVNELSLEAQRAFFAYKIDPTKGYNPANNDAAARQYDYIKDFNDIRLTNLYVDFRDHNSADADRFIQALTSSDDRRAVIEKVAAISIRLKSSKARPELFEDFERRLRALAPADSEYSHLLDGYRIKMIDENGTLYSIHE